MKYCFKEQLLLLRGSSLNIILEDSARKGLVCVYIWCVCIYIYVYMCVFIHIYVYVCVCEYICM